MFDIEQIRESLNERPFRDGKREICVGRLSELFENESQQAITEHLDRFQQSLRRRTLTLVRHDEDPDALYVAQELRVLDSDMSWMADAMQWVSRITTFVVEMALAGLAGMWLDKQFGTGFLTLIGVGLGVALGMWHLILMTKRQTSRE